LNAHFLFSSFTTVVSALWQLVRTAMARADGIAVPGTSVQGLKYKTSAPPARRWIFPSLFLEKLALQVVGMAMGLRARLILRALIDDLAVVHVQPVRVHSFPAGHWGHMEVLDAMQVGQRKGKAFSLIGRNEFIDIDRVNGLTARLIATTVAERFPASGEAGEKDISHNGHSCYRTANIYRSLFGMKQVLACRKKTRQARLNHCSLSPAPGKGVGTLCLMY
jgi:hypothetical protein